MVFNNIIGKLYQKLMIIINKLDFMKEQVQINNKTLKNLIRRIED